MHAALILETFNNYAHCNRIVGNNFKQIRNVKKQLSRCHRTKCGKIRGSNKFYVCKRCFAAVYCSRRCFKKDWNCVDGIHRNHCQKYVDIMNDKESMQQCITKVWSLRDWLNYDLSQMEIILVLDLKFIYIKFSHDNAYQIF